MAPLRSRRPRRSSSTSARWKPSMGTHTTGIPRVPRAPTSSPAIVDLPAPGDPVMPRSTRVRAAASSSILATRPSWSAASREGTGDAGASPPSLTRDTASGMLRQEGEDGAVLLDEVGELGVERSSVGSREVVPEGVLVAVDLVDPIGPRVLLLGVHLERQVARLRTDLFGQRGHHLGHPSLRAGLDGELRQQGLCLVSYHVSSLTLVRRSLRRRPRWPLRPAGRARRGSAGPRRASRR